MTGQSPKRRWYQYSLRTLLVFMVLFAIACSWFTVKLQQVDRRREAVRAIVEAGGWVGYDYKCKATNPPGPAWMRKVLGDDFFGKVVSVELQNDEDLEHLRGLTSLEELYLRERYFDDGTLATDAGLQYLKRLTNLQRLDLGGTRTSDAGVKHLKGLTKLRELVLDETQVTDAGLKHLKELTNLEWLDLDVTQVTDAGLKHLKGLTNLEKLYLQGTQITDIGLKHLGGLTNLKDLALADTHVTEEGIQKLQQALPKCKIVH